MRQWQLDTRFGTDFLLDSAGNYFGVNAQREWENLGCTTPIPIETDTGRIGTDFGHWDEVCLARELMTGFLTSFFESPLSRITVGGLEDLGFTVNYDNADDFTLADVNNSCCNPRRRLRGMGERQLGFFDDLFNQAQDFVEDFERPTLPALSEVLLNKARGEAVRLMSNLRQEMAEIMESNDEVVVVGGDVITIFMFDDDGNLRHQRYSWDDDALDLITI